MDKIIRLSDDLFVKDKVVNKLINDPYLRGHVCIRDHKGNIILEEDNLIVLRGRTFVLEKLFDTTIGVDSGYIRNLNRKICLFKIGSGGADIEAAPFDPVVPAYSNMNLTTPFPFITVDSEKNLDAEKASNTSIVTALSQAETLIYYDMVSETPDPARPSYVIYHYYAKKFEAEQWYINKTNNEIYRQLTLRISEKNARNEILNELGLYIGQYNDPGNNYSNLELFSRITFDSEPLGNANKQLVIDYIIYA